jgi:hypothetical protein
MAYDHARPPRTSHPSSEPRILPIGLIPVIVLFSLVFLITSIHRLILDPHHPVLPQYHPVSVQFQTPPS